jgi:hypothetical protein
VVNFLAAFLGSVAGLLIAGTVLTAWGTRRERVRRMEADLFKRCAVNAVNIGRIAQTDYERGYWTGRRDQSLAHYNMVSDEPFTLEDGSTFPPDGPWSDVPDDLAENHDKYLYGWEGTDD